MHNKRVETRHALSLRVYYALSTISPSPTPSTPTERYNYCVKYTKRNRAVCTIASYTLTAIVQNVQLPPQFISQ